MSTCKAKSRGCHACRALKVKCDRTAPSCQRCIRRGKACPGYADETSLIFRDMNKIAEKKVKMRTDSQARISAPPAPKPLWAQLIATDTTIVSDVALYKLAPAGASIPTSISLDWRQIAMPRFFADYGGSLAIVQDDTTNCFFQILADSPEKTYYLDAVKAIAFQSLANQTHQEWLGLESRALYGKAMLGVAKALQTNANSDSESILASTLLFSFFELLATDGREIIWRSTHHEGQRTLLLLRGEDQFKSSTGRQLFGIHYTASMLRSLTSHIKPAGPVEEWLQHFGQDPKENMRLIGRLNLRNVYFCADAQILFDQPLRDDAWLLQMLQLIKMGMELETDYQAWSDGITAEFPIKQLKSHRPLLGRHPIHVYQDIHVAWLWNHFRLFRTHLHEVLKRCDILLQSHPKAKSMALANSTIQAESNAIIADMVSDICSSIPFYMGEIDAKGNIASIPPMQPLSGRLSLFPIYIAMISAGEGSETESWLRSKLEIISGAMGLRVAARFAKRERKHPWDIR